MTPLTLLDILSRALALFLSPFQFVDLRLAVCNYWRNSRPLLSPHRFTVSDREASYHEFMGESEDDAPQQDAQRGGGRVLPALAVRSLNEVPCFRILEWGGGSG